MGWMHLAVIGWCIGPFGWSLRLKYYKNIKYPKQTATRSQIHQPASKGFSGCPPTNRGRHYDRKFRV